MTVLVIGGAGFIGRRLVALLVARGERVVFMDINPAQASFEQFGEAVEVVHGDVTQFDDVVGTMTMAKPDRVLTLPHQQRSAPASGPQAQCDGHGQLLRSGAVM